MKQAKELVEQYYKEVYPVKAFNDGVIYDDYSLAKKGALICANEVLKTLGNIDGQQESLYREEQEWIEIKEYLENEEIKT